jgi:imidazolonepropionase-like amidohydrolase
MVLRDGLHVDGSGPDPAGRVDLLIEGERIVEISEGRITADDAQVIDLGGRAVMPGLIDCHTHATIFENELPPLAQVPPSLAAAAAGNVLHGMLMRGFTSVRDAAGADWGLKEAISRGYIIGPRLFICGHAISQTGGHGDFRWRTEGDPCGCGNALRALSRIADGCDAVRAAVREELRQGADQIKIMASGGLSGPYDRLDAREFTMAEMAAAVEEAEARGSYVMAHAYTAEAIRRALESGVRSIEHGNLIDDATARLAAERGAYIVPTLVTFWAPPDQAADPKSAVLRELLGKGLEAIGICRKAGVPLGYGTDLFGEYHEWQSREFLIRADAQPAHEIIASATRVNARILNQEGRLGVLAPGALADLLVVEGNPLEDVSLLAKPAENLAVIIKGGAIVKNLLT